MIRIGIDVGGTNTDAVVMDGTRVVAGVKSATTADVMSGVVNALKDVLAASDREAVQKAADSPDCPVCDVLKDGQHVGSVV